MEKFDRIARETDQMNEPPCIRGMRLTMRRVVGTVAISAANLEDGAAATPAA